MSCGRPGCWPVMPREHGPAAGHPCLARSVLRHIRVASKAEHKQGIMVRIDDLNRDHTIHTWSHKVAQPAR